MYIGLLSDTHGDTLRTQAAARVFETFRVERVVHCGDIGTPGVIKTLAGFPTHYVFGNCDNSTKTLREAIEQSGGVCHDRLGTVVWDATRIAFLHGDNELQLRSLIQSSDYDLVCHGHTHVQNLARVGDTLLLNPGALSRTSRPSIAIVDLPSLEVVHVTVQDGSV